MIENRQRFMDDLKGLNTKVVDMGDQVIESYKNLLLACENLDNNLLIDIIEKDKLINEMEVSINVDAYLLIAKQCPVASDLRRIITALKISNELERIGDYAVNISKFLTPKKDLNPMFIQSILTLTNHFIQMLKEIVLAFKEEDIEQALEVSTNDEVLDGLYKNEVKELIKLSKTLSEDETEKAIQLVLILKQIERAGDHVTNIAENIVYLVNGKRVELD